jgi:cardiolipin synthase
MPPFEDQTAWQWLGTGNAMFSAMLQAIDAAKGSVCLETYIFSAGSPGERIREALVRAQQRGARVRVIVDAVGSIGLPGHFWQTLQSAGGEARQFNPLTLKRFWFRNHRKLLVCDGRAAFVGGFNIAPEYEGDGIQTGWRDLGLRIEGPLAAELAVSFEEMFARADFRHKRFLRLPRFKLNDPGPRGPARILLGAPCRGRNPIKHALHVDLAQARDVRIMTAYFLPTWRLRHDLARVARRGGRVQLILAGKSDVAVSQLAAQSRLEIHEYQPQILHAKLIVVDDVVYVGSANLDQRSLRINYEMMIRFENPEMADQARGIFDGDLQHCRRIQLADWRRSWTLWQKLKRRLAYLLLVRIDPYIARWQWRELPD